jgi:hypothetical protein
MLFAERALALKKYDKSGKKCSTERRAVSRPFRGPSLMNRLPCSLSTNT